MNKRYGLLLCGLLLLVVWACNIDIDDNDTDPLLSNPELPTAIPTVGVMMTPTPMPTSTATPTAVGGPDATPTVVINPSVTQTVEPTSAMTPTPVPATQVTVAIDFTKNDLQDLQIGEPLRVPVYEINNPLRTGEIVFEDLLYSPIFSIDFNDYENRYEVTYITEETVHTCTSIISGDGTNLYGMITGLLGGKKPTITVTWD